jgi:hypothetical protein
MSGRTCSVDGCDRPRKGRGLCGAHWSAAKRQGKLNALPLTFQPRTGPCTVEGCDDPILATGLCSIHYDRKRRTGTTDLVPRPRRTPPPCISAGCQQPATSRGMCPMHYQRVKRTGTFEAPGYKVGDQSPLWKGTEIGYAGAHMRLRKLWGSPAGHTCADCGQAANDWSYDGADPDERVQEVNGFPLRYSPDPTHYAARCTSCHRIHDAALRRAREVSAPDSQTLF